MTGKAKTSRAMTAVEVWGGENRGFRSKDPVSDA
jgi:hypothetical protein